MSTIIDGKALAAALTNSLHQGSLQKSLGVIQIGNDPASTIYIHHKEKQCQKLAIPFFKLLISNWHDINDVCQQIVAFVSRPEITGIILQIPLPKGLPTKELLALIPLEKDVDGLLQGSPFIPATARAVMHALKSTETVLTGKHAVIIGYSALVGKPLVDLLLAENCTVTVTHIHTQDLPTLTRQADILISAVGKINLVSGDMVQPGVIAIDVGINRIKDGEKEIISGDLNYEEVSKKASFITPVPGGVGPLTVAFLMANVLGQ
ncbi:bifunctional 5,10-methylenetetrahydrofolate dehydrogenase/5,10-methenyltetrahydrofolate cyclohydrolase [Candidatus Gracilibacteria bacterium]|nr:bifunctional 5,10-methylenetetrahydrofolate dehydrogenase/5,10-methenyltetrahydrofolate cyclohydrolase [Candidatus Gracilibacteria bacterium]